MTSSVMEKCIYAKCSSDKYPKCTAERCEYHCVYVKCPKYRFFYSVSKIRCLLPFKIKDIDLTDKIVYSNDSITSSIEDRVVWSRDEDRAKTAAYRMCQSTHYPVVSVTIEYLYDAVMQGIADELTDKIVYVELSRNSTYDEDKMSGMIRCFLDKVIHNNCYVSIHYPSVYGSTFIDVRKLTQI